MKSFWEKSLKIINNRKRYFQVDIGTQMDQIFALLDIGHSYNEDEIDELINDSDTEFITPEVNVFTSVLTPEASFHFADEGTTHTKDLETNEKRIKPEKKYSKYMEMQQFYTLTK